MLKKPSNAGFNSSFIGLRSLSVAAYTIRTLSGEDGLALRENAA